MHTLAGTKWIIRALVILGLVILAMVITGTILPEKHTATASREFQSDPDEVWKVLTDFAHWPEWRSDLREIRVSANTFTEISSDDEEIEFRIEDFQTPERMVTRIITPDLPFGGSWTYELTPTGNGCRLTITENGEVYNALFRFMSKYMFGHTATMEQFLEDLSKKVK
jgi:uncharacterized protein YndB with AHSA1/START domain